MEILQAFKRKYEQDYRSIKIEVQDTNDGTVRSPFDSAQAHFWNEVGWRKMCLLRTRCMQRPGDHDFVFFLDSDTVLLPPTLAHLVNIEGTDMLTEIHWTSWEAGAPPLPNVWSGGQYRFAPGFLEGLRKTTVAPVGGMGGVVLIPRRVLAAGVTYQAVPNLDYQGEDRHFCVRAAAMGFRLHADTYYPALHLYRQSILDEYLRRRAPS